VLGLETSTGGKSLQGLLLTKQKRGMLWQSEVGYHRVLCVECGIFTFLLNAG